MACKLAILIMLIYLNIYKKALFCNIIVPWYHFCFEMHIEITFLMKQCQGNCTKNLCEILKTLTVTEGQLVVQTFTNQLSSVQCWDISQYYSTIQSELPIMNNTANVSRIVTALCTYSYNSTDSSQFHEVSDFLSSQIYSYYLQTSLWKAQWIKGIHN